MFALSPPHPSPGVRKTSPKIKFCPSGMACLALLAGLPSASQAGQLNHFAPGIFGTRDFFIPAESGFYYSQMDFNYLSDEFHDAGGHNLDSLTLSHSLDQSGTFSGSRSFTLEASRGSSFSLSFQGSDLGLQLTTSSTASVGLDLSAEATARLRAQSTIRAHVEDLDVRLSGISPTLVWASDAKFLGARLGMLLSLPIMDMSIDARIQGTASIRARVDGALTARAIANLRGSGTVSGTLSAGGRTRNTIQPGGSKTFTVEAAGSATAKRTFHKELSLQREFTQEIHDSSTALGDFYMQPLWLDWSGDHYDVSLSDGFYAPTGRYHDGALDNTGFGFWTNQAQAAAAWYPWKSRGTALTVATTYEVHGNKQGADIRPGSDLTVNWGVSQFLPLNKAMTVLADIGVGGYDLWQVSNDRGSDVTYDAGIHDEVHAVGVQLGLAHVKWAASLTLRWMHEYAARDRFQGDMFVLNFAKKL